MLTTALTSTIKGQLQKSKRISVPIRLQVDDHNELKHLADIQQRSMSFIAMRRYLLGRNQELLSHEIHSNSSDSNIKGVKNVK
ncbi:hypothetical protein [Psychrobacter sp. 4Bb]|uniref:hypothetical protein n=1 Tax=Psychrobacter sp. 4Bb TaxID=888436 RepID=UPI000C7CCF41|nr:hypothetical protein [Psychrobacter sp. 4Bb]PKH79990.1 hypothetical protein CXF60_11090 [Psychrobacter sp. 4Bb]